MTPREVCLAAAFLALDAQDLFDTHTVKGRWPRDAQPERNEYRQRLRLARALRRMLQRYHAAQKGAGA